MALGHCGWAWRAVSSARDAVPVPDTSGTRRLAFWGSTTPVCQHSAPSHIDSYQDIHMCLSTAYLRIEEAQYNFVKNTTTWFCYWHLQHKPVFSFFLVALMRVLWLLNLVTWGYLIKSWEQGNYFPSLLAISQSLKYPRSWHWSGFQCFTIKM